MAPKTVSARRRAAEVLARVDADRAFAAAVLDTALSASPSLSSPDRALATELVYGVLRTAPALDAALARFTRDGLKSIEKADALTRAALRVAAYQILCLGRVPPFAAVSEAVEHLKQKRSQGLAGFANAVLRKLAVERPAQLDDDARVRLAMASLPVEVTRRVAGLVGAEAAALHLRASFAASRRVSLRVNLRRSTREALIARLRGELAAGAAVEAVAALDTAVSVIDGGDVTQTAAYAEGLFGIQEEGAQRVAALGAVRPAMTVLDVCAGRGGKSALMATQLAGAGSLTAVDLYPEKLMRLREEFSRLGLDQGIALHTHAVDLTQGLGALERTAPPGGFDVVMVDAPCSGLGTLAHRPDLLGRLRDPAAWAALVETQRAIVARVAPLVRVGGRLVYAVCTLTREEGDDALVAGLAGAAMRFAGVSAPAETAWAEAVGGDGPARVILRADRDGTDGFVVHRRVREA